MGKLAVQGMSNCALSQPAARRAEEKRHWMIGIAITLVLLALFALAVTLVTSSVKANNALCLKQIANEEHLSLDAYFQNPAQQNALAEALTVCSR